MGRCIYLRKGEVHTAPVVDIKAGDLPIGQIVKLMEGGVETEFIVVNQGIPENSNLYDASCNGTWLLRKDIKENRAWNSSDNNTYSSSTINVWLNGDYINSLGNVEQQTIRQVKIPYVNGTGSGGSVVSGANGLSTKVFLLGGYEVGFTTSYTYPFPVDGAKLDYFESGTDTSAKNKRIANFNGSAAHWWLRSPLPNETTYVRYVHSIGSPSYEGASVSLGIRPALIIPSTSLFDGNTYVLLGGASEPPLPVNIYTLGANALSNVTNFYSEKNDDDDYTEISFTTDGLKLSSKYGFASSSLWFNLNVSFITDYKTLVVKVGYQDLKGTPKQAIIGWGNGNYGYNLTYYNPSQYENYHTTHYSETSFVDANSITAPVEYRIDISTITSDIANYQIAMKFVGSGTSDTTWGCYALITDIHLE